MKAVYLDPFDPITYGHLDIINQASKIFDELIIAIEIDNGKRPLFSVHQRKDLISKCCLEMTNVRVENFYGHILMDYVVENQAALIRELKSVSDFEKEFQIGSAYRSICQIVYFMPKSEHLFISSNLVKEVALSAPKGKLEEMLGKMVGPPVIKAIADELRCGKW